MVSLCLFIMMKIKPSLLKNPTLRSVLLVCLPFRSRSVGGFKFCNLRKIYSVSKGYDDVDYGHWGCMGKFLNKNGYT